MFRFCYIAYFYFCININNRITSNHTLVTTAKDITNGTDGIINFASNGLTIWIILQFSHIWDITELLRYINCRTSFYTFRHVDVYLGIAINICLKTTAKDVVNTGCRLDIHSDFSWIVNFHSIFIRSRIRSLITTAKQVLDY